LSLSICLGGIYPDYIVDLVSTNRETTLECEREDVPPEIGKAGWNEASDLATDDKCSCADPVAERGGFVRGGFLDELFDSPVFFVEDHDAG